MPPNGCKIATGKKKLEVRRWKPDLTPKEDLLIVENGRFLQRENEEDQDGRAVAVVKVTAVRAFLFSDMEAACASYFEEGWLAWELSDIRPISKTIVVRAARGIYTIPTNIVAT